MSYVGLSFGSPTSGAGFDVSTTVASIVANLQTVEAPWKTELATLQSQDTALSSLGTNLSALSTDLESLTDFDGVLSGKEGSSSDTNVLELTSATSTATAGTHTVVVNALAQNQSFVSSEISADAQISGSLTLTPSGGSAVTVAAPTDNPTLAGLAKAINLAGAGVDASVITDSNGSRLSLVSSTSGTAGGFTVGGSITNSANGSDVSLAQTQAAQDAAVTVDGIALTSGSNDLTSAIPGVTLQLLSASPGTSVQVVIANNTSAVATAVQQFVADYNTALKAVNAQEGKTASGTAEPLFGTTVLSNLQGALESALTYSSAASGSLTSITQLGVSVANDGSLTLNTDTLNSAIESNYGNVTDFFQNASSFGSNFTTALNDLGTSAPYGSIYLAQQGNSSRETELNTDIANEDTSIASQQTTLTTELTDANYVLQSIPSQLDEIKEMYAAITGYGENS